MNKKSCKWFITDTFFKRSFFQMMTWMNMLMIDLIVNQHEWVWKEKKAHRVNLKYCTYQSLKDMNKIHTKIIKIQEINSQVIQKYIKQLETVCNTLWLRRDINQSMFFNFLFTNVKLNEHQDIDCSLSSRFNKLVNFSVMTIIDQLRKKMNKKKQDWINNHCIKIESQLNINNWMMKVCWFRVLNTFSHLEQLSEIQSLVFSEVKDWDKKYVCFEINHLYDLKKVESFYEKHILEIIFKINCIKIKAINMLINDVWNKNEKIVFCIMNFMNALILYWVSDRISTFC